jgi:hypothetical protein
MNIQFTTLGQSANVTVSEIEGDILISLSTYPTHAQMAIPLEVAVKIADGIIAIARKQLKGAA